MPYSPEMTRKKTQAFSGLDVKATTILEIADDSNFNIIIDERTG